MTESKRYFRYSVQTRYGARQYCSLREATAAKRREEADGWPASVVRLCTVLRRRHIDAAERAGAEYKALLWLRKEPRTIAELVARNREWAKWAAIDHPSLPDEYREALEAAGCGRSWWRGGKRHREDGPAIEYANGSQEWWQDGKRHRVNGPAVEYAVGSREWWRGGKRHREDGGPAVEYADGSREWWQDGKLRMSLSPVEPDTLFIPALEAGQDD